MRTLVVLINAGNYVSRFMLRMIDMARRLGGEVDWVTLAQYHHLADQVDYHTLVYNTFPDEAHGSKFEVALTEECDAKFRTFRGRKILLDTHDRGDLDGFARMEDWATPRIKSNPSRRIMESMNVVMSVPYVVYEAFCHPQEVREGVVCALRTRGMPPGRQAARKAIWHLSPDVAHLGIGDHARRLCRALVNVVPNGNGDSCRSHVDSLAAGALLMAEEGIEDIKILPYADLVHGENFVSYNLDNLADRLEWLLEHRIVLDRIRLHGLETFREGYDIKRSAEQFLEITS